MTWLLLLERLHLASAGILALLADATLKGSLVLLAASGLMRLLRTTSAARRHLILLLAILSLPVLPVISLALPRWVVLPAIFPVSEPAVASGGAPALDKAERARNLDRPGRSNAPISGGPGLLRPGRGPGISTGMVAVWLAGMAWIALRASLGRLRFRRLAAQAEPLRGTGWAVLARAPGRLNVEITRSRDETMPVAWGVLRAHVMLPNAAEVWPVETRKAVIYHEIAHLERLDPLTHAAARIVRALFWFNPLLWWALRRLGMEQERACDDVAVARLGSAPDYAEHLVHVVATVGRHATVSLGAPALARRSALEQRVRDILDPSLPRDRVPPGVFIASACLALSVIAPLSMLDLRAGTGEPPAPMGGVADLGQPGTARRDPEGRTELHLAAREGDPRAIPGLVADGLDVEAVDNEGRTPLHLAAGSGRVGTVTALLEAGSDLSARDMEGRTPLHVAARNGHPRAVSRLLAAGASAQTVDFEGRTPLESAAANGKRRVVRLLLESDSSPALTGE